MLVITLGDPYSVNIEILSQVLPWQKGTDIPIVLVGSFFHWQDQWKRLGLDSFNPSFLNEGEGRASPGFYFLNRERHAYNVGAEGLTPKQRGEIATAALSAVEGFSTLEPLAVLTMPIDKHAASLAGFDFPGQTEFFEHLWQDEAVMTLAGPKLKVGLVTNHLPLAKVSAALSEEIIYWKARKLLGTLQSFFGYASPRLAVTGLNPHASDKGLFGCEEQDLIAPAIARLLHEGFDVQGPLPADTAFAFAYQGRYDGVLAMYHDQGLGPLKLAHFDEAVNISGGLKHLRISPDHGPASDLFLKKQCRVTSTAAAFSICEEYLQTTSPHP